MRIVFCTTCRSRLNNLKATLPGNLALLGPGESIVTLDYNCPQGTAAWAAAEFPGEIAGGLLRVYRESTAPRFFMAHAKNVAHLLGASAGASVLVNLDADNSLGPVYLDQLRGADWSTLLLLAGRPDSGRGRRGSGRGRVACRVDAFLAAGGYDEDFVWGWGYDDTDLTHRTARLYPGADAIQHARLDRNCIRYNSSSRQTGQLDPKVKAKQSIERHARASEENLAAGRLRANAGRRWGVADLVDSAGVVARTGRNGFEP